MAEAFPAHPRPSCHAVVFQGDAVLLVQRAGEPFKGWWGLPGGAVELGETVEEALEREVQEETGIRVRVERLLGFRDAIQRTPEGRVQYHYVILYFLASPAGGHLTAADDAAAARWVPMAELDSLPVTDSVKLTIRWAKGAK